MDGKGIKGYAIKYHCVKSYTHKVRIYPTKEQMEKIDRIFLGLEKAANITLWNLKNHNELICEGKDDEQNPGEKILWANWYNMAKKQWLDFLRAENELVARLPASCLSSSVGGLFLVDMKKAWEKQGKLPIDKWFAAKNKKGKPILRFYGKGKRKTGYFLQIPAKNFKEEHGRISVTVPSIGKMRIRGWNRKLRFGEEALLSFFEYYADDPGKMLSCRITKNNVGEYYLAVSTKDTHRPFKEYANREPLGIDVNITERTYVTLSNGSMYSNPKYKAKSQDKDDMYHALLSRRYGIANEKYRKDCSAVRRRNKDVEYEESEPLPEPSRRYKKVDMKQKMLSLKTARRREQYQNYVAADIVSKASKVAIESLNVKGMLRNNNLSKSLSDAAFSAQLEKIKYKSEWCGIKIMQAGMFDATSHICPDCGYRMKGDEKFGMDVRHWTCPNCGAEHDRDVAAARNILNLAKEQDKDAKGKATDDKPRTKRVPKDKVLDKNHTDIIIHYSSEMKEAFKNPWIVVTESGEVLDDAQGYGYDTAQKAQKAYKHKMRKSA